jgi:Fe2+ or Zn2+ uptake regulation protein
LEADRTHPTAEQLHASLRRAHPSLSLSTVYNTLESFVRAGLCERVNSDGVFRVDGVLGPDHDHAFCRRCGRVYDVDRRQSPPVEFPSRLPRGLVVRRVRIEYEVVCADCRGAPGA